MDKKEIRHFKSMLRQGSLRHMNIILDDKFQKELLNIIKDYEDLQQKIDMYENPEDLTLMFMYCDEKAKDKIKQLSMDLSIVNSMTNEYAGRIIKAIAYINKNKDKIIAPYGDNADTDYEICLDKDEINKLLEILEGRDKDDVIR